MAHARVVVSPCHQHSNEVSLDHVFIRNSNKLTVRESGWVAGEGGSVVVAAIRAGTRRNDDEAEGNEGAEQVAVVLLGRGGGLPVRVHDQRKR